MQNARASTKKHAKAKTPVHMLPRKIRAKANQDAGIAIATTKTQRIPPRKARLAADLIRGMKVEDALVQLAYSEMKGGILLKKTLESAIANAENQGLRAKRVVRKEDLRVKEVRVDAGRTLKRSKSKSKGGTVPVMKRTSHFTIIVAEEEKK